MMEWLRALAEHYPIIGSYSALIGSLIGVGWFSHANWFRIKILEEYRKVHSEEHSISLGRLDKVEDAVLMISELLKRFDGQLSVHEREIYRLRDWKDRHEERG